MGKIKCIIVDDEPEAREGVAQLLRQDPEVEIVALCANGLQALEVLEEKKPDLLLLDIQMPQVNGFEVLNSLPSQYRLEVIFITAYDEYTLQAFEVHAVDYLLKPFTDERFYKALNFAKVRINQQLLEKQHLRLDLLLKQQSVGNKEGSLIPSVSANHLKSRLAVKAEGRVHLLPYAKILWVEAYDYYIKVHTPERYFLLRDSMKNMEKNLPDDQFARIHKSSIVNLAYVQEVNTNGQHEFEVTLDNGTILKVSRNYKERIKSWMSN